MTGATWASQGGGSVSADLAFGHDVRLAEEAGRQAPTLDLVAEGGCADAEFGSGLGESEHGLELHTVAVALAGRPAIVVDVAPTVGAGAGRGHGVAGEVGVDLVEPAFEGLAPAFVPPGPDLIGV